MFDSDQLTLDQLFDVNIPLTEAQMESWFSAHPAPAPANPAASAAVFDMQMGIIASQARATEIWVNPSRTEVSADLGYQLSRSEYTDRGYRGLNE